MKFNIPHEPGDDEINMTAMIDVVFLLLIFFMVASHLTALERVPVALPVADKAKIPKDMHNRQMITVLAEENGRATYYMNLQKMSLDGLGAEIKKRRAEDPNLQVCLRADRQVHHKHVKAVMAACADAGIADVIFGAFESGK
ncbi:MAG: biopolymer transporter ExbD [Kiritimatiellales bacterium]